MLTPPEDTSFFRTAEPAVDLRAERSEYVAVGLQSVQIPRDVRIPFELGSENRRGGPDISSETALHPAIRTQSRIDACSH